MLCDFDVPNVSERETSDRGAWLGFFRFRQRLRQNLEELKTWTESSNQFHQSLNVFMICSNNSTDFDQKEKVQTDKLLLFAVCYWTLSYKNVSIIHYSITRAFFIHFIDRKYSIQSIDEAINIRSDAKCYIFINTTSNDLLPIAAFIVSSEKMWRNHLKHWKSSCINEV